MVTAGDLQQIRVSQIPAFQQGVEKSPTAEAPPQEASCRQLLEKGDWMEEGQPRTRKQEAEAASTLDTHTIASDGRGLCGLEVFPLSRLPPESGTRHIFSPLWEEGTTGEGSTHAQKPFLLWEERRVGVHART